MYLFYFFHVGLHLFDVLSNLLDLQHTSGYIERAIDNWFANLPPGRTPPCSPPSPPCRRPHRPRPLEPVNRKQVSLDRSRVSALLTAFKAANLSLVIVAG